MADQPLEYHPPADAATQTEPTRRRWRWEQVAVVVLLLAAALVAGLRPGAVGEVGRGLTASLLAARAWRTRDHEVAASAWARVRRYRPDDQRFLGAVTLHWLDAASRTKRGDVPPQLVEQLFRQAVADGDPRLVLTVAGVLLERGEAEQAVSLLEAGLRRAVGEDSLELRSTLAGVYDQLGRHAEAEQLHRGLLEAQPENPTWWNNLAWHYAERDTRLPEAERLVQRAIAMERRAGRLAFGALRRAHHQTLATYRDTLGWVYFRQGRLSDAKVELTAAVELSREEPNAEILCHLGQVCYDLGQDRDALRLAQEALRVRPGYPPAQRLLDLIDGQPDRERSII